MADQSYFSSYHMVMVEANALWAQSCKSPVCQIADDISTKIRMRWDCGTRGPFYVVDAGCGVGELALRLEKDLGREPYTVSVVGLDAPSEQDWRKALALRNDDEPSYSSLFNSTRKSGVLLSYKGGNFVQADLSHLKGLVHFMVFSLSLSSTENITAEINMARTLLVNGGTLYIADLAHRFMSEERSFLAQMERCGFQKSTTYPLDLHDAAVMLYMFRRVESQPKAASSKHVN